MSSVNNPRIAAAVALALSLGACATNQNQLVLSNKSAVELRSIQSRAFDTGDRSRVYRAVLATFQDLGYTINKVEPAAGTVTADKLGQLKMTATVYPRGETRTIVRSNAIVAATPQAEHQVDAPEFYQQFFFEPLSKALFLEALKVEGDEEGRPTGAQAANSGTTPPPAVPGQQPVASPSPAATDPYASRP